MTTDDDEPLRFEDGMAQLETLVARLEAGDLALEEALQAFESGVGLVRVLNDQLTQAEQRVEILTRGADGQSRRRLADDDEL
ncbi:exodeoxyribonuclease VII small subunit [bacterium]|nr:exodeoxyribonuclease VII small subunit [bacterium]